MKQTGEKSSYSDDDIIKLSREHGIGRKAAEALYFIKRFGPLRQYEVAEKVSLDASTVSHHLKILQEKGLIEKDIKNKRESYYKSKI